MKFYAKTYMALNRQLKTGIALEVGHKSFGLPPICHWPLPTSAFWLYHCPLHRWHFDFCQRWRHHQLYYNVFI